MAINNIMHLIGGADRAEQTGCRHRMPPWRARQEVEGGAQSPEVELILVRHGERLDEAPDETVIHDLPPWDPPLTRKGIEQARAAGQLLREEHAIQPFESIYVSPCARTLATASHIAAALGGGVYLQPVPGLAECATAVNEIGLAAFDPSCPGGMGISSNDSHGAIAPPATHGPKCGTASCTPHFLAGERALSYCAQRTELRPIEARYDEEFEGCVWRLAAEATARGVSRLLLCTHREGIRDLAELAGVRGRVKTPYCCVARFAVSWSASGKERLTLLSGPSREWLPPSLPAEGCATIVQVAEAAARRL